MESKDLTIVIVTFNSEAKILNCINSIPPNLKIIVVENSNNENFKKFIEHKFKNIECILVGENKGYAAANNIGLSKVNSKYALVLNPDTILENNVIENFLKRAKEQDDFWLIGPATDQMVKISFGDNNLAEVDNLKGFAIFFNVSKFKKFIF